ncbi:MAG: hypothetical protein KDK07_14575 [Bauldia sp.]|nr:hypothetical protein [Bauldia sp.]
MSDTRDPTIAAVLKAKLDEILARRARNEKLKAAIASEDLAIDRDLADLRAAVRVLGAPLEIPETDKKDTPRIVWRAARETSFLWDNLVSHALDDDTPRLPLNEAPLGDDPHPHKETAVPARPPIKDIVLARLKDAGAAGSGATAIRKYIEQVYGEIHRKTVGMTLYRLSKDGLVRRDGNTWFLAKPHEAETRNPGADTPGSLEDEVG